MQEIRLENLNWSEWFPLEEAKLHEGFVKAPGIYRVRRMGQKYIDYVGQTNSLRGRMLDLRLGLNGDLMPWNEPHVAAARFWALRQEEKFQLEASIAVASEEATIRRSYESLVIAHHRLEFGFSPSFNFGRMPDGWTASSSRSKGNRGHYDKRITSSLHYPCLFEIKSDPLESNWLGIQWISFKDQPPKNSSIGIYRAIDSEKNRTIYIGESKKIYSRIAGHQKTIDAEWQWFDTPSADKAQRLEIENDLIGSYISVIGSPPTRQFHNSD